MVFLYYIHKNLIFSILYMNNNIKDLNIVIKKRSLALAKAQKKYYEKNKEKLTSDQVEYNKKYVKKDVKCDCGAVYKMSAKYLHMRSKKHKRRLEKLKNGEPSIPSTLLKEKQMNIFLRTDDLDVKNILNLKNATNLEVFTKLRDLKDNF